MQSPPFPRYLALLGPDRKKKTNNIFEFSAKNAVEFTYCSSCEKNKSYFVIQCYRLETRIKFLPRYLPIILWALTDTSRNRCEINVTNRDNFLEIVRNMGSIQRSLSRDEHAFMQAPSILLFLIKYNYT